MIIINMNDFADVFMSRSRGDEVFKKIKEYIDEKLTAIEISSHSRINIILDESKMISFSFLDEIVRKMEQFYTGNYLFEFRSGTNSSIYEKLARISGFRNSSISYKTHYSDSISKIVPKQPAPLPIFQREENIIPTTLSNATVLWIDAGFLSGGSRSQIEFPEEIGRFFKTNQTHEEVNISIIYAGITFPEKRMEFHGNSVWRLNLPTEDQGLGEYDDKVLVFEKTEKNNNYRLWLVEFESPAHNKLKSKTLEKNRGARPRRNGRVREYGYF